MSKILLSESQMGRFMKYVDKTGSCWLWTGGRWASGYGVFFVDSKRRAVAAHRVSYEHFVDSLGDNEACHSCDTPACVNPAHLFPGSHAENMRDMAKKGRAYRGGANVPWQRRLTHCKRGHAFTPDNLMKRKDGLRECKECYLIYNAKRREKSLARIADLP